MAAVQMHAVALYLKEKKLHNLQNYYKSDIPLTNCNPIGKRVVYSRGGTNPAIEALSLFVPIH